jgi:hypothetical protein
MPRISLARLSAAGMLLVVAGACDRAGTLAPTLDPVPAPTLARIDCTANVRASTLRCTPPATPGGVAADLVLGGQGTYVFLEGTGVSYTPADSVWSADLTVKNLIPQPLGTADGATLDGGGVRVFFVTPPTATVGSGAITILNAAGTGTFTASNQAFYQWDEILDTDETSAPQPWRFHVDPAVETFAFAVYVTARVPFPDGWIDLVPAADTVLAGGGGPVAAVVRSAVGNVIPDEGIVWDTSDPTVGTVDGSGVFTAVGAGSVTVTATAGARTGSVTVAVCPNLAVGEVFTAVMPRAADLCFSGGNDGPAEYTYMPVNLSAAAALGLSVTGSGIVGVAGPPTPNLLPGTVPRLSLGGGAPASAAALPRPDEDAHLRRMAREARELAPLMGRPSARIDRTRGRGGPRFQITPGVPAVGDLMDLNVAEGCSGTRDDRTGRVVSIGQHVIVIADTMNPAGGFSTAQYDSIAMEFDSIAHPVVVDNFGAPTDLDGNGRVIAFYTRAVNELSPPGSSAVVAGFFAARDLFSSSPEGCPLSNEGEMFYMLAPDPTGEVNGNVRTVGSVRGGTVGTLGHEFQHLVNAARRLYVHETSVFEEIWLNEGLSHVTEELMFYRTAPGLAPRQNIDLGMLTSGPDASLRVAAFNRYANQNYGRLRSFLQRPDTAGVFKSDDVLATRGATWAFLRYAADRRGGDEADFWFDLVNTTTAGMANLQTVLGTDPLPWVRDFTAALYADDAVAGIGIEYQTTSWHYRSVYGGLGGFPLLARPLADGTALDLSYSAGGGTSFLRFGVPANGFASVGALSGGSPPASPYALIVVRTK